MILLTDLAYVAALGETGVWALEGMGERGEGKACNEGPTFLVFHIHLVNVKYPLVLSLSITYCYCFRRVRNRT